MALGRHGYRMRVHPHEQRAINVLTATVLTDCLRDRQNMRGRKTSVERSATMSTGTDVHELIGISEIRLPVMIRPFELLNVIRPVANRFLTPRSTNQSWHGRQGNKERGLYKRAH